MAREFKKYRKLCKKFRKRLRLLCDKIRPWDYQFGLDFYVEQLRFLLEYYKLGENVFQVHEGREKIIRTVTEAIDHYEKWMNTQRWDEVKKERELFFNTIRDNIECWWD